MNKKIQKARRFAKNNNHRWPEGAVVYQIYPRSFYDSNADGIGDIPGVTAKLPYLKDLGVNAIWLSPFYPSPMADFGYDVADYCGVDPIFGSLSDMDELIKAAHAKDIKIIVDLVPNHSSDEHFWFRQSKQSREGKYADWYIWKDAKGMDDKGEPIPPNNWLDIFTGESAWEWVPARQQFYLHSFDVHQPDLNWTNPEVREAIKSAMRFWLDKGVDGFRVDAVRHMGKDKEFRDNPKNPHYKPGHGKYDSLKHIYSQGMPELYDYLQEMSAVLKEEPYRTPLRFMITESYPETHEPVSEYLEFYKKTDPAVAAPFNFEGLHLHWHAEPWRKFLSAFHKALYDYNPLCVASYAFGNHDKHRLATRLGDAQARSAAVLMLTLPGMVFIYNGEEIGMVNVDIPPLLVQDPAAKGGYGRDPARTPLQWSAAKNAGFTTARSAWLPVGKDYLHRNVEFERLDSDSYFSLYKKLCHLRNKNEAIRHGEFNVIKAGPESVLGYTRTIGKKGFVVLVNFANHHVEARLPEEIRPGRVLVSSISSTHKVQPKKGLINLRPHEAVVIKIK